MIVGRVVKVKGLMGEAEFTSQARMNDFICYRTKDGGRVMCQITSLESLPYKGVHGKFTILEHSVELPRVWDHLFLLHQKINGYIHIGRTAKGETVKFGVNPFFRHMLLAGKTGKGKTHVQIAMQEEFLTHKIPSVVVDTQGELIHLNKFSERAFVVEDMRFEDLLSHLRARHTVIFNYQGLSYTSKAQRCYELLSQLKDTKEKDYKHAENDIKLLEIPPVIVDIDETEIYAPEHHTKTLNKDCRDTVIDIAKRGGKIGIGLIVSSQRLPGLHCDVRSQCNSAMIFQVTDSGSRTVLSQLPYLGSHDLNRVKNLSRGECIITGEVMSHPTLVMVRDIETCRAKSLDFEGMLGLKPLAEEEGIPEEEQVRIFEETMAEVKAGITFEELASKFPIRKINGVGDCLVIPERHFKSGWDVALATQGYKALHSPDMPGGGVYLIRKLTEKEKVVEMANQHLPRDASKRAYK